MLSETLCYIHTYIRVICIAHINSKESLCAYACCVAQAIPPYPFASPPSTISFSIFYFPLFYVLRLFLCFSIPFYSTRIVPVRFQAGCRRRRLNLAVVFLRVDFVLYVFLVKDACLFLSYLI